MNDDCVSSRVYLTVTVDYSVSRADLRHHGESIVDTLPDSVIEMITANIKDALYDVLDMENSVKVQVEQSAVSPFRRD